MIRGMLLAFALTVALPHTQCHAQPDIGTTTLAGQVELARLVDASAQRLRLNIEYDAAAVKGQVTLRLDGPISDTELWTLTNRVLAARGLTTVRQPGQAAYSVVKITEAAGVAPLTMVEPNESGKLPVPLTAGPEPKPGFQTVAVRARHRPAKELAEQLGKFSVGGRGASGGGGGGGAVSALGQSNLVVISDLSAHLDQIAEVLNLLDTPGARTVIAPVAAHNISATQLLTSLTQLTARHEAVSGQKLLGDAIVSPDGMSLLIVAPEETQPVWRQLVEQLDQREPVETITYSARHFAARDVARLVEQTIGGSGVSGAGGARLTGGSQSGRDDRWRVIIDELTDGLVITATPSQHAAVEALIDRLNDVPAAARRPVRTFVVRNRPVDEIVAVVEQLLGAGMLGSSDDVFDAASPGPSGANLPVSTPPAGAAGGAPVAPEVIAMPPPPVVDSGELAARAARSAAGSSRTGGGVAGTRSAGDSMIELDQPPTPPAPPVPPTPVTPTATEPGPVAVAMDPESPTAEFLSLIPHDFARRHLVLSAGSAEGRELLLVADRTQPHVIFNVGVRLRRGVSTRVVGDESLAAAIDQSYRKASDREARADLDGPAMVVEGSTDVESDLAEAVTAAESDLIHTQGKAPSIRLVDLILFEALLKGASDVHVQPLRDRTLVRYRLDGALHTVRELPASLAASVISRIKVMGRMDVAERRAPQDGRATVSVGSAVSSSSGRRVDLRISTLPSTFGERIVVRLLDASRSPHLLSFSALGMPEAVERRYLAQVSRTSGIVLSTGPTGSGKTTTLYTTLAWISSTNAGGTTRGCELNMMTVEDPVEYDLSGVASARPSAGVGLCVSQTQVDLKKNLSFANGLRHILRQDPDVIMVGEIRDDETARIAVQASLTGHLVLSTLHTNDAAGAVARLLDLGVEPFLVASSLSAVLAQRLVRRSHAACRGLGCDLCVSTGFKGRTGVFELLVVDPVIRDLIGRRASALDIKVAAHAAGMVTLKHEGQRLVTQGVTTAAEVTRVIEALDDEVET